MRFLKDKCVSLFIDYQEKLVPAMKANPDFIKNSQILAKGLLTLEVPMILSEQYRKGLGDTIPEIKDIPGVPAGIEKTTFSLTDTSEICDALKQAGRKQVIISGCEAHICVLQTAVDLIEQGYSVMVVADCLSSRKEKDMKYAFKRMEREGVFLTTYEAVLYELLREAKGDAFKTVSGLIK